MQRRRLQLVGKWCLGIDDHASRIASIIDDDDTHLVDYEYLGRQSFVNQESLS